MVVTPSPSTPRTTVASRRAARRRAPLHDRSVCPPPRRPPSRAPVLPCSLAPTGSSLRPRSSSMCPDCWKAVVIHVPYRLRKAFKKIHVRLVRELEKKFSGKDVVIVATRRILRPPKKGSAVQRPHTRTLTVVHDGIWRMLST
ncbi:hypothetical protein ABZP36_007936 [Zizania latifolia]